MSANQEQWSFDSPDWFKALRLDERLANQGLLPCEKSDAGQHEVDFERARLRLQRWRSEPQFVTGPGFAQRLQSSNLNEEQFLPLLGETSESLRARSSAPPAWLVKLQSAFSHIATGSKIQSIESLDARINGGDLGLLALIWPLLHQSLNQLHQGIESLQQRYSDLPFDAATIESLLFSNLPVPLFGKLGPTMALELNVARLRGQLEGETTEQRFRSFLARLQNPQFALGILQEYPVLVRQLIQVLDQWVSYSLEFLSHLCSDWTSLVSVFSPENAPGTLTQVSSGTGDTHRDGRSVIIATFSSGLKIVYKPHSLSVDCHFMELLEWVNERNSRCLFRILKVLNRSSYGWAEFIAASQCDSVEEVELFYERQGGFLALLYALEATDFHLENLIAAGEHPVLIDLEALFQPRPDATQITQNPLAAANEIIGHSVLRIGLLPQRLWTNDGSDGVDLSGLGGAPGQLTRFRTQTWAKQGTDEMHLIRRRTELHGSQNRPSLGDMEIGPQDYADCIVAGFVNIYRLVLKNKDELVADDKLCAAFGEDEVRAVLRPTHTYASLLNESFHPDVLRDGLDRERLFDFLWTRAQQCPSLSQVIPFEQSDLQRGDIPFFSAHPASRDLWTSDGECLAGFFTASSLELVHRRLQILSEDDLVRQVWFIRASLATLTIGAGRKAWKKYRLNAAAATSPGDASREKLTAAALEVGERIAALSLHEKGDVSWLGVTLVRERIWQLMPLGTDLYDGSPGVIMFLAYLGVITGQKRFTELAQAALQSSRRTMEQSTERSGPQKMIGAFNGLGGWIYLLTHLGALWAEPRLLDEAERMGLELSELVEADTHLDIISGTAGGLGALLCLYRCRPTARNLAAAIRCGDHLIARTCSMPQGVAWKTEVPSVEPLTGFSHGVAGIAWALLELFDVTRAERFRRVACEAIAYERSTFSVEQTNWPDFRAQHAASESEQDHQPRYAAMWCHGAGGIGLARLAAFKHLKNHMICDDVNAALKTTRTEGFGYNHSLCHGDLGNLELLLHASRVFPDSISAAEVERRAGEILSSIKEHGWLCGVPHEVESPGLMTGLAGIGYGLLRHAEPDRVPSLLLLEPPRTN